MAITGNFVAFLGTAAISLVLVGCQEGQTRGVPTSAASASSPQISPATQPQAVRYRMADCHLHLVDFLQRTDGIQAALSAMDRCGVEDAVVSGMPLVKEWPSEERLRPDYYLSDDSRCYWYSATDVLVARQVESLPLR